MDLAEVNGQRIAYTDSGGDADAIIFSHGFLMDGSMFDSQVAALRDEFRCVTWDQRGHGGTLAPGPFTYWDSADDALALLTHLGIARATFTGMSQGGFLSMRAALRAPDRVRALVLIDSQSGLEDPDALPLYEGMHDEWMDNGPVAVQETAAAIILGATVDPGPWYAKWGAADRRAFSESFRTLVGRDDITGRLAEITQPTLIIHGSDDAAIPMWRAEQLRGGIPGVRELVVVEGAGHASNVSHPEPVNRALLDFLHNLGGTASGSQA
jgi:pimeloyl-ACP methyl ester carboxylesterase